MDFNIEVRLKQLQSLDNFISYSRDKVQSILDCLQWHVKDTVQESSLIKCSVDPNHRVSANSVETHIQKCLLKKEGYDVNDEFLSEPIGNTVASIRIIDPIKIEVLSAARQKFPEFKSGWNGQDVDPQTSDRLLATFSPDERLVLYDYAVANTTGPPELPEFNILQPRNNEGTVLTEEELLRKERDAKRRRIKYKSVHTNRKNYTEIIRDVINGQMELYSEWINGSDRGAKVDSPENSVTNFENTEKHSLNYAESVSKHSTYSASSSSAKYNGDAYSNNHSYEYSHNSHERESSSHEYSRSEKYHRSRKYSNRSRERSHKSDRRHRSRSSERRGSRKRRRSRSRSRHKHYSRNRR